MDLFTHYPLVYIVLPFFCSCSFFSLEYLFLLFCLEILLVLQGQAHSLCSEALAHWWFPRSTEHVALLECFRFIWGSTGDCEFPRGKESSLIWLAQQPWKEGHSISQVGFYSPSFTEEARLWRQKKPSPCRYWMWSWWRFSWSHETQIPDTY